VKQNDLTGPRNLMAIDEEVLFHIVTNDSLSFLDAVNYMLDSTHQDGAIVKPWFGTNAEPR
jgi:hypothetical protein